MTAEIAADKAVALTAPDRNADIAVAIHVESEESLKLSAALRQFMPPEIVA